MSTCSEHSAIQAAAKAVLVDVASSIGPTDTERTIAERATSLLSARGLTETWYYNCPALVLLGSRSCLSLSGRDYVPSDEPVGAFNSAVSFFTFEPHVRQANGRWGFKHEEIYYFDSGHRLHAL